MKTCQYCGEAVLFIQRSSRRYCSAKCRVADHRQRKLIEKEVTLRQGLRALTADLPPASIEEAMSVNPFDDTGIGVFAVPFESPLTDSELLQILPDEDSADQP
jgi:hypothetical protein